MYGLVSQVQESDHYPKSDEEPLESKTMLVPVWRMVWRRTSLKEQNPLSEDVVEGYKTELQDLRTDWL